MIIMVKTTKKNKICFSTMILILFVIMSLIVPYVAIAEDNETYDREVEYGVSSVFDFQYDGIQKVIKINNAPDVSDGAIIERYGPDAGSYIYLMGKDLDQKTLSVTIDKRPLTVKPVDVVGEYIGKKVMAESIEVTSGTSLVNGHYIDTKNIVYGGVANGVGKIDTYITGEIRIYDSNNIDVTHNYEITRAKGYINLSQPFVVTVDPEEDGKLGGGKTAKPTVDSTSSNSGNSSSTSTSESTSDTLLSDKTEGTTDTTSIVDADTPLASGLNDIPNSMGNSDERANTTAATALFLAVFAVLAVIAISIIHIIRRKIRENGYYWD